MTIDALPRRPRVVTGALVLGRGFLWSDLSCYAAGIALAVAVDVVIDGAVRRREG